MRPFMIRFAGVDDGKGDHPGTRSLWSKSYRRINVPRNSVVGVNYVFTTARSSEAQRLHLTALLRRLLCVG